MQPKNTDVYNGQSEAERRARSSAVEGKSYGHTRTFSNSFSGTDIIAYIHIPPQRTNSSDNKETAPIVGVLGNIQTISYSTFREVEPVRSLGKTYSDGYTRGPRTIAGTIVWTVLDQHVIAQALQGAYIEGNEPTTILADQLPPFNIIITFNNEYGDVAQMGIYGVRVVNEGAAFSIDDMITEQTNSFVASDIDMLHKGPPFKNNGAGSMEKTGSDILVSMAQERMRKHGSTFR